MSLKDRVNRIREIMPGVYQIIFDFATTDIVPFLISDEYRFVWVHDHTTGKGYEWEKFNLPLKDIAANQTVLAKWLKFDFILPTDEFKKIMSNWKGGIKLVQLNEIPPYYVNLDKLRGKPRYEKLVSECDFLFEVDIPSATDYGTIVSTNKQYLQSLLDNPEINWDDLP